MRCATQLLHHAPKDDGPAESGQAAPDPLEGQFTVAYQFVKNMLINLKALPLDRCVGGRDAVPDSVMPILASLLFLCVFDSIENMLKMFMTGSTPFTASREVR